MPSKEQQEDDDGFKSRPAAKKVDPKKGKKRINDVKLQWLHSIHEPSNHPTADPVKLMCDLELEFVHGYRIRQARNNMYFSTKSPNSIIFPAGSLGITMNLQTKKQNFFSHHTDDVLSIAYDPVRGVIASGQIAEHGGHTFVHVWKEDGEKDVSHNIESFKPIATFNTGHINSIDCMDFSCDGKYLCVVGSDTNHTVLIYDWQVKKEALFNVHGHSQRILDVVFHPKRPKEFVTVGEKHFKYWDFSGTELKGNNGVFGDVNKLKVMLCVAFVPNEMIAVGSITGDLHFFKGKSLVSTVTAAHEGALYAIRADTEGFITGGSDGIIHVWNIKNQKISSITLKPELWFSAGEVSCIRTLDKQGEKILVGLSDSAIVTVEGNGENQKLVVCGHDSLQDQEVWGLAAHPFNKTQFATCAEDGTLRIWDTDQKTVIAAANTKSRLCTVAFHPQGKILFTGEKDYFIRVFETSKLKQIFKIKDASYAISTMQVSPSGHYLAVASHDLSVKIYEFTENELKLQHTLRGHSAHVTHLDWSEDGEHIRTNSADMELWYWNVNEAAQNHHPQELKNTLWHSGSCPLSWETQGVWLESYQHDDINAVECDPGRRAIVAVNDFSEVVVHNYPAVPEAPRKAYAGHFLSDTSRLITAGGMDGCVLQWKCTWHCNPNPRIAQPKAAAQPGAKGTVRPPMNKK